MLSNNCEKNELFVLFESSRKYNFPDKFVRKLLYRRWKALMADKCTRFLVIQRTHQSSFRDYFEIEFFLNWTESHRSYALIEVTKLHGTILFWSPDVQLSLQIHTRNLIIKMLFLTVSSHQSLIYVKIYLEDKRLWLKYKDKLEFTLIPCQTGRLSHGTQWAYPMFLGSLELYAYPKSF